MSLGENTVQGELRCLGPGPQVLGGTGELLEGVTGTRRKGLLSVG